MIKQGLIAIGVLLVGFVVFVFMMMQSLPECTSPEVLKIIQKEMTSTEKILSNIAGKPIKLSFENLKDVGKPFYKNPKIARECQMTVYLNSEDKKVLWDDVNYNINKTSLKSYYVKIDSLFQE